MGSLILCHKKRAKRPFEIARVHMRVYTIEELCYYICNNLYLIDHTIMNRRLCDWLDDELGLEDMAEELRRELDQNAELSEFVLTILQKSIIYAPLEITRMHNLLDQLQNQKEVEKAKYKADTLLKAGEYAEAILVYQSVLNHERDDSVKEEFYGKIHACLGTAYGCMFLYEEAAAMYKEAYRICQEPDMLKAYLYCCRRYLPGQEYMKMLSGNPVFLSMSSLIKEEIERAQKKVDLDMEEARLTVWKKEYRGS